jgi:DNA invertase Pin-like site-specific DNA recombinase
MARLTPGSILVATCGRNEDPGRWAQVRGEWDLTAQRTQLAALGVPADRVYLDQGLTGTARARPGLDQALAAVREGDTLVVTKLDGHRRYATVRCR